MVFMWLALLSQQGLRTAVEMALQAIARNKRDDVVLFSAYVLPSGEMPGWKLEIAGQWRDVSDDGWDGMEGIFAHHRIFEMRGSSETVRFSSQNVCELIALFSALTAIPQSKLAHDVMMCAVPYGRIAS